MINLGISLLDFKPSYSGGINSFSLGLAKSLEKKCKLHIYTNKNSYSFLKKKFPKSKIIVHSKNNFLYLIIKTFSVLIESQIFFRNNENRYYSDLKKDIEKNCDVFYCPLSYLKPLDLKIPSIVSIHDLQHEHFPQNFNLIQLKHRKLMYGLTVRSCSKVQVSSDFIRNDVKKIYPMISKKKTLLINEGVSDEFKFQKYNPKNNFILFPAQLWPHKNHLIVLKSLKNLYTKHNLNLKLIMVGGKFSAYKNVNKFINENKYLDISYLGNVSFKKLLSLFKNCRFLISPAIYESSSIPILEACKIGRPVIASKSKSNLEMSKTFEINFFDTLNYKNLSSLLLRIWDNKRLINSNIKKNSKSINKFSWDKISDEYLRIFLKLSKR